MHQAAKLEFERAVREFARCRAVPEPSDRQLQGGGGAQRLLFEHPPGTTCRLHVPGAAVLMSALG